jgi:3-oxoacyl-[acyl-carrier-protein] synthase-3
LAALIQEDIGANPEDPHEGGRGTFSFDVANGTCGVLTAFQIADGFLRSGTIDRALVVASDANPGLGLAPGFPFSAAGGAALCVQDDGPRGLVGFRWETWPEEAGRFTADVGFDRGRNRLRVQEQLGYDDLAAACAARAAAGVLADHETSPEAVDVIIANPQRREFLKPLADLLRIDHDLVVAVDGADRVHTAGLIVALDAAVNEGRVAPGRRALLVSAGAGVTAGAALWLT